MKVPRLVLLPGLDGTGDLFDPLIEALSSELPATVVRYTSPSLVRYSDCRAAVLTLLPKNEPYILLGESFSGPIAVSIAAAQPSGLCGLVLSASFVSSPRRLLDWLYPCIRFLPTHSAPRWATDLLLLGDFASPDLRKRVASTTAKVAPDVLRARLREIALINVSEELQRVTVPILYLRATRDRLVPRSNAERIARLSSRVRTVDIEAPHLLLQCAPRECARIIGDFAWECSSPSPAATAL